MTYGSHERKIKMEVLMGRLCEMVMYACSCSILSFYLPSLMELIPDFSLSLTNGSHREKYEFFEMWNKDNIWHV